MKRAPLQLRLLLLALAAVALLPFMLLVAEYAGLIAPGLEVLVAALAVVLALLALLVFEPPQALSLRQWGRQLRRRFESDALSPPPPSTPARKA